MNVPTNKEVKDFVKTEMHRKKLSQNAVKKEIIIQGGYYPGLSVWLKPGKHGILLDNLHAVLDALRAL